MEKIVHLSSEALRGILLEKSRHPGTECVIAMPGVRKGDDFYFDMVADSGINATYEYAWCEKDHEYVAHLSNRISEYYDIPEKELTATLVHLHPPGYNRFSGVDKGTNDFLAKEYGGAVAGLMWVDPKFRMKFWYIDEEGKEHPAKTVLDDEGVRNAMPKKNLKELRQLVEMNENPELFSSEPEEKPVSFTELFRFCKKKEEKLSKNIDLMEAFPEFKEELSAISMNQKVHIKRKNGGTLILKTKNINQKDAYFKVLAEDENLALITEGRRYKYQKGLLERLLALEEVETDLTIEDMLEQMAVYTVHIPEEYKKHHYVGPLYGFFHKESREFNIVPEEYYKKRNDTVLIGYIRDFNELDVYELEESHFVCANWKQGEEDLEIYIGDLENPVQVEFYSFIEEAFSRNTKIVESDQMKNMQAIILGAGSVGSFIALELAKVGIGSIILADDDKFAYHNISRHQCGIHDVGKFKVDALEERIADINPFCKVVVFRDQIQHVNPEMLKEAMWKNSIFICCADNRHAAYICKELVSEYHIPMVTVGCGPRASTGELFYYKPDGEMDDCMYPFSEDQSVDYSNQPVTRKFYATEAQLEKMHFQPGMSLDIEMTSIMAAKLAIDILMEKEEGYKPKLLPYISQGMMMVNYSIDEEVNPIMRLFKEEDKTTVKPLQWRNIIVRKKYGI